MRQRGFGVGRDVVPRYLGQHPLLDAKEGADLIQGLLGLVDQQPVAQDEDLLAREEREQVLKLLAVTAQPGVVPETGPPGRDPALLFAAGPDEVTERLQARRPQVRPVGVGPLHRIAHDHDQPGVGQRRADPAHRGAVIQVERGGLTAQGPSRSRVEQRLVIRPAPDVLPVGECVSGPALGRRRPVGEKELRLLDRRHVQARVTGERRMQRRGPRLRGTDHQEVGHSHGASSGEDSCIEQFRLY